MESIRNFAEKERREKKVEEKEESKAKAPSTRRCKKNKVTDAATHTTSVAAVTLSESASPITDITTDGATIASTSVSVTSVASTSVAPCTSVRGHETSIGEVTDPNKCSTCLVSYGHNTLKGATVDWIFCKCGTGLCRRYSKG